MKFCGKPCRYIDGQTLKGYTARQANQLLQRAGQLFWQTESYDHSVRDLLEGRRIRAYIENNPVKAGLAAHAEEYPWSSAIRGGKPRRLSAQQAWRLAPRPWTWPCAPC